MNRWLNLWSSIGYDASGCMVLNDLFSGASRIILTDNPEYTLEMYRSDFPQIGKFISDEEADGLVPAPLFNLFLSMANACIKYDRYKTSWRYLMGLYISHFIVLWAMSADSSFDFTSSTTPKDKAAFRSAFKNALPTAFPTSKTVDGLSISYDFQTLESEFAGYGTYRLTPYGQQLITLSKLYGMGGLWVNR